MGRADFILLVEVWSEGEVLHVVDVVECCDGADVLGQTGTPGAAPLLLLLLLPVAAREKVLLQGDGEHLPATHLGEVVHAGELQERGHAVEEGADDEPVQRGGVVDLGQPGPAVQGDGGESEDGRDALRRPEMTGSVWWGETHLIPLCQKWLLCLTKIPPSWGQQWGCRGRRPAKSTIQQCPLALVLCSPEWGSIPYVSAGGRWPAALRKFLQSNRVSVQQVSLHLTRGVPGEVDLPVLGVDDVKLRQLELPLVAHGQGGVVPPVADLRAGVGDWNTHCSLHHHRRDVTDRSQIWGDRTASPWGSWTASWDTALWWSASWSRWCLRSLRSWRAC